MIKKEILLLVVKEVSCLLLGVKEVLKYKNQIALPSMYGAAYAVIVVLDYFGSFLSLRQAIRIVPQQEFALGVLMNGIQKRVTSQRHIIRHEFDRRVVVLCQSVPVKPGTEWNRSTTIL